MKEKLSLKEFILNIKKELEDIQTDDYNKAFFELKEVNLEVSFVLDTSAEGSGKFVVVDLKGATKSTQIHKVSVKLDPIKRPLKNTNPANSNKLSNEKNKPLTEFFNEMTKEELDELIKTYPLIKKFDSNEDEIEKLDLNKGKGKLV